MTVPTKDEQITAYEAVIDPAREVLLALWLEIKSGRIAVDDELKAIMDEADNAIYAADGVRDAARKGVTAK